MSQATTVSTGKVWLPGAEFVKLTFTSGDTYASPKFKRITGAVHSGIQGTTSTSDTLTISIGTTDSTSVTLMSNTAKTSLSTCLIVWGDRN